MNILFAGSPKASAKILDHLHSSKAINVTGVITQPDKPQKRGKKIAESHVSAKAKHLNIPIYKPCNLNDDEFKKSISSLKIDFLVVAAYGKILPKWLLGISECMPINVHYSILPAYRGASPIQSTLLNGDETTGVTFMKMNQGLDEGDIIKIYELPISKNHNKLSLEDELSELAVTKINDVLNNIFTNNYKATTQNNELATYCNKIKKTDSYVNFKNSSDSIINKYRAFFDWPGTSFIHKEVTVKIAKMHEIDQDLDGDVGDIIKFNKTGIYFKTSTKIIVITYLQMPNKNIISAEDAFNAYRDFFS